MEKDKQLETLLVIVIALVSVWFFGKARWLLVAAVVVGLLGILSPLFRMVIHSAWMWLSKMMGEVSGRILLTVVYCLLLLPIAVVARWMGKISLRRRPDGDSCFIERGHTYKKEDMIHPW